MLELPLSLQFPATVRTAHPTKNGILVFSKFLRALAQNKSFILLVFAMLSSRPSRSHAPHGNAA
jgi:hypothetical protein